MEYDECETCAGWCCALYRQIRVRKSEFSRIAKHLAIPVHQFIEEYITRMDDEPEQYRFKQARPCGFWVNNRCEIHEIKPKTCSNFDPASVPDRYNLPNNRCEDILYTSYIKLEKIKNDGGEQ